MKAAKKYTRPVEKRDIPGYEGLYSISRDGRIWSHQRTQHIEATADHAAWSRVRKGKWMHPTLWNTGYVGVRLSLLGEKSARGTFFNVHRLVMLAWGTPQPTPRHQINHKDSNKTNNHISNLEWVLPRENTQHAIISGKHPSKPGNRRLADLNAQLTEAQVLEIRARYTGKHDELTVLAKEFGTTLNNTWAIVHRRTWKHI